MVTVNQLHWLAGMAEGEGSFYLAKKRNTLRTSFYPEMTIQSTDYDIVFRMAQITGSRISGVSPYGSSKLNSYKIRLASTRAIQWMMTLYPLMGTRRKAKIRDVIAY